MTQTEKPTVITVTMIEGQFARHAVIQHPYKTPQGLFELVELIGRYASQNWVGGSSDLPMKTFAHPVKIEAWLRQIFQDPIAEHILKTWNTPHSQHKQDIVFSSRYDEPKPEDDFIGIDALLRNTALEAWREAKRDDESDARIEAKLGHGPLGPTKKPDAA